MIRRLYGANPLHFVGHLLAFALIGYAAVQITGIRAASNMAVWLVGAVLLHDVVLWPLYSGADRAGSRLLGGAVNYVRVPLGLSLLLVLVFVSTLLNKGDGTYMRVAGRGWEGYVRSWLLVTAGLFVVSGVVYLVRRSRR